MRQSDFHAYIFRGLSHQQKTLKTTACQGPLFFGWNVKLCVIAKFELNIHSSPS